LNPATPAAMVEEVLGIVDRALVMTVNPGFGGQAFIGGMTGKISTLSAMIRDHAPSVELAVDGGVKGETAPVCAKAGATVLISGTGIFNHPGGVSGGIAALRAAAR
ncbi:MAG: ribulose-phosphate 3-epimerase, partial [Chloroflexota bacterium]